MFPNFRGQTFTTSGGACTNYTKYGSEPARGPLPPPLQRLKQLPPGIQLAFNTALQDVVNTAVVMKERALWSKLKQRFPDADLSKFHKEVEKKAEGKTLVHVVYEKDGLEKLVFSDDHQVRPGLYYTPDMLSILGKVLVFLYSCN